MALVFDVYILTPMAASTKFSVNDNICFDGSGNAAVPADTANFVFAGTALQNVDNGAGTAAALTIPILPKNNAPSLRVTLTGASQASCGKTVYWTGANTVATSSSNSVVAGVVVAFVSTNTVDIKP